MKYISFYKVLLCLIALITVILQLIVLEYSGIQYKYADYLVISSAINIMAFTIYVTDLLTLMITGDRRRNR